MTGKRRGGGVGGGVEVGEEEVVWKSVVGEEEVVCSMGRRSFGGRSRGR